MPQFQDIYIIINFRFFFINIIPYNILMEELKYNLLTINGITKICDNNIYVVNSNEVLNYQWHYHQLKYVCDIIGISTIDSKTGLNHLPEKLGNLINTIFNDDPIIVKSDNIKKDISFGIVPFKIS